MYLADGRESHEVLAPSCFVSSSVLKSALTAVATKQIHGRLGAQFMCQEVYSIDRQGRYTQELTWGNGFDRQFSES